MTHLPDAADLTGLTLTAARLRLVLDAAQVGLWDWDVVTGELVWDARSAAMFGTTVAESTGSIADVDARVHPADLPRVREVLAGAIDRAGAVDVEFRVVWPDGSVHWLYGRGQALVDADARVVRLIGANLDVTDSRRAERDRAADAQRMAGLVAVAQALGSAQTEDAVLRVLTVHGAAVLGADGTVLVLAGPGPGSVRVLTSGEIDQQVRADVAALPADFPLPMVHTAVTGTAHFFPDRAAAVAAFPGAADLYGRAGTQASATVPLPGPAERLGALGVAFDTPRPWRAADRDLLEALAALTAQALERLRALRAERASATAVSRLSETLQRSLLSAPPQPDHLEIAARYQPAAHEAQVGGDWYDAFVNPEGNTMLVIGDVAGHDGHAAAAMAHSRNVLRGVAQALGQPPAAVLSMLDRALARLQVSTLATAVLCEVCSAGTGWILRWSNAGHPPPLLLRADGSTVLLERHPDLLLGLNPDALRLDHEHPLAAGDTVLLYTDGLVERRREHLDDALVRLRAATDGLAGRPLDELCDTLLARLATDAEDDVALIALRPRTPLPRAD